MVISLKELARAPHQTVCFDYSIDLTKEELNFEFPFQSPVRVEGQIEAALDAVRLEADVEATVTTRCARCNRPVQYEKVVPVDFVLTRDQDKSDMDEVIVLESDSVDLDDIMRTELILDLESAVLCRDDCAGLCPKCGADLNEGPCGCDRKEIDPRLAKLQQLLRQE